MARSIKQHSDREQFWRELIGRQQGSGQSIKAFCVEEGVSEASFFAWRAELSKRDREEVSEFAPVQLLTSRRGCVEILLSDPPRVRVEPGFDLQTLRDVLAILEKRSC
ncbi:MAG: hypothetical protein JXB62_04990 [Pirellulales bacterium]|nr:hypothetical protein [Pirellulales bacterium]